MRWMAGWGAPIGSAGCYVCIWNGCFNLKRKNHSESCVRGPDRWAAMGKCADALQFALTRARRLEEVGLGDNAGAAADLDGVGADVFGDFKNHKTIDFFGRFEDLGVQAVVDLSGFE